MAKSGRRNGICALCGEYTTLTGEDATPRWLGRFIDRNFPARRWEAVEYTQGVVGPRVRSRNVNSPAAYKAKILCASCNNEWGSRLETEAKPLLSPLIMGEELELGDKEQTLVATWAVKTAIFYEFVKPTREGTTASRDDRLWFRANRAPLPRSKVWIGRYEGTRGAHVIARSTLMLFNADDLVPQPVPSVLLVVLVMGQLALRVVIERSRMLYPARYEIAVGNGIHALWPTGPAIAWPAEDGLDDPTFDQFMTLRSLR